MRRRKLGAIDLSSDPAHFASCRCAPKAVARACEHSRALLVHVNSNRGTRHVSGVNAHGGRFLRPFTPHLIRYCTATPKAMGVRSETASNCLDLSIYGLIAQLTVDGMEKRTSWQNKSKSKGGEKGVQKFCGPCRSRTCDLRVISTTL